MRMILGKLAVVALALMTTGCNAELKDAVLTNALTFATSTATALIQALFPTAG